MNRATDFVDGPPDSPPGVVDPHAAEDEQGHAADSPSHVWPLRQHLLDAVAEYSDKRVMLAAVANIILEHTPALGCYYSSRDQAHHLLPSQCLTGGNNGGPIEGELSGFAEQTCTRGQVTTYRLAGTPARVAIQSPVYRFGGGDEVMSAVVDEPGKGLDLVANALEMAAAQVTLWYVRQAATEAESEAETLAVVQDTLGRLEDCPNLRQACTRLVNDLQSHLGCERMILALRSGSNNRSQIQAISGSQKFDAHAPLVAAAESALDEAILRDAITVWPPVAPGDRHAALAHHRLCGVAHVERIVSSPLRNKEGEAIGAWLFMGTKACFEQPHVLDFIRAAEPRIASCLSLLQRAEGGLLVKLSKKLSGYGRGWRARLVVLVLCGLVGALLVPMQYKVRCDCRLEPVLRRFVAAPYDALLDKALVTSGARVTQGDILARMDGREIRWELAGITAERDRAVKQRDAALATRKFAAADVAGLEVDRFELKMKLLEQRQRNLAIKSPIDGIVTVGDLEKAEGAPVTCGQTLFEIAPLEKMTVEVAIPQSEIRHVGAGQEVLVQLESCPHTSYQATLTRVRPRSEIREQQNVFVAEATLQNSAGTLRPGMQGRAKIVGPRRSLAWILFHRPWEALCLTLGW